MTKQPSVLMSIHPRHVGNIVNGTKSVELRRRSLNLKAGTLVWIYSTLPDGCIRAVATVKQIHDGSRSAIWRSFKDQSGVSKVEFDGYFEGSSRAYAIELEKVRELKDPIHLENLREEFSSFHPPQFFMWLREHEPLSNKLFGAFPEMSFA